MTETSQGSDAGLVRLIDAPTRVVWASEAELVYRDLGADRTDGVPLVGCRWWG